MTSMFLLLTSAMTTFETANGFKPTCLYLGDVEHDAIATEMRDLTLVPEGATVERMRFNGAQVFRVDTQNHIGLA